MVLADSADVSLAAPTLSNVASAISSNGWYCGLPFGFAGSEPGPNCSVDARIPFFTQLLLFATESLFDRRILLL